MRSFLILLLSVAFLLAAGCAPVEDSEYDDYRGGGYLD